MDPEIKLSYLTVDRTEEWTRLQAKRRASEIPLNGAMVERVLARLGFCLLGWFLAGVSVYELLASPKSLGFTLLCVSVLLVAVACWVTAANWGRKEISTPT